MRLAVQTTIEATRQLVIVSHDKPELFDHLARRFRNSPDTTIVFDHDLDRFHLEMDTEGWRSIDALLRVVGYTIIVTR